VLRTQTITFASPGNQVVGTTAALTATASSTLNVQFASSPSAVCTVNGSTLTLVAAGTCTVTATQSGDGNYSAVSTSQVITVTSGVSAANGKLIYNQVPGTGIKSCGNATCHTGHPKNGALNILAGANKPTVISDAITRNVSQMSNLRGLFSQAQLADIAAYLAVPD
jgi:mono/diheme cytochrome c family protein